MCAALPPSEVSNQGSAPALHYSPLKLTHWLLFYLAMLLADAAAAASAWRASTLPGLEGQEHVKRVREWSPYARVTTPEAALRW